jgi:hypothetical protein
MREILLVVFPFEATGSRTELKRYTRILRRHSGIHAGRDWYLPRGVFFWLCRFHTNHARDAARRALRRAGFAQTTRIPHLGSALHQLRPNIDVQLEFNSNEGDVVRRL